MTVGWGGDPREVITVTEALGDTLLGLPTTWWRLDVAAARGSA